MVRANPNCERQERLTWTEPASYHAAVEFFDLAARCTMTLRDLPRKAIEGRG